MWAVSDVPLARRRIIPRAGPQTECVRGTWDGEVRKLVVHDDSCVGTHDVTSPYEVDLKTISLIQARPMDLGDRRTYGTGHAGHSPPPVNNAEMGRTVISRCIVLDTIVGGIMGSFLGPRQLPASRPGQYRGTATHIVDLGSDSVRPVFLPYLV